MDGGDMESSHRMLKGQPGLQELLCRKTGAPPPCNGATQLQEWLRGNRSPTCTRGSLEMEETKHGFRELNERSVPRGDPRAFHPDCFQGNASGSPAPIP